MKFSELLEMLREMAAKINSADAEDLAVNFRMTDVSAPDIDNDDQKREPGIFYISIKNGNAETISSSLSTASLTPLPHSLSASLKLTEALIWRLNSPM